MIDGGNGNVEGLVIGIIGDAQDVVGTFGAADAFEDYALVGVEYVGFAPLEKYAGVVRLG